MRPSSESHDIMRQTDDFKNNLRLIDVCKKDINHKFYDGLSQAREHVAKNESNFAVYYPIEQIDNKCKVIKFKQANSRKG